MANNNRAQRPSQENSLKITNIYQFISLHIRELLIILGVVALIMAFLHYDNVQYQRNLDTYYMNNKLTPEKYEDLKTLNTKLKSLEITFPSNTGIKVKID